MIVERFPEPIDAFIIKDTFGESDFINVVNELRSFDHSMTTEGVWISDVYKDTNMSSINRLTLENFFDLEFVNSMMSVNSLYGIYTHVNNHSTQVRHYGNGEASIMHYDAAAFTIMTFVFNDEESVDPVNVTLQIGGDIAYEQKIDNNMTIIFPSSYYVALSEVSTNAENAGLYTISSYLFIESR